jgi:hypothetical protein
MTELAKVLMDGIQEQFSHFLNIVVALRYSKCRALKASISIVHVQAKITKKNWLYAEK